MRLVATWKQYKALYVVLDFFYRQDFIRFIISNHFPNKYTLKPTNSCIRTWFRRFLQLTKKKWVWSYQSRILLLSLKIIMPFSLVRNVYLSAEVRHLNVYLSTRRASKISTDMCLSSLKKVCEVAYF